MSGNSFDQQQAQSEKPYCDPLVFKMREQAGNTVVSQSTHHEAHPEFDDWNLIGEDGQQYISSGIIWQIEDEKML